MTRTLYKILEKHTVARQTWIQSLVTYFLRFYATFSDVVEISSSQA